jgi:hypothetical protein
MAYEVESDHELSQDGFVDWADIRILWEAGASLGYITKRHPVHERNVAKRALEWDRAARDSALALRGHNKSLPVANEDAPPVGQGGRPSSVPGWLDMLARVSKPRWDEATFPMVEVAQALHNVASGMPVVLAAEAAGITERVCQKYRNSEPRLDTMFRQARAMSAAPLVKKIMEDRDWRAAAWLLERGIAKAEFKQEAVGKDDKLTIEIMVSREDKAALANVIDVTESANAPMVAGLPAFGEAEDLPRS